MATTHLKDLAVVVDTYQDRDGNEKKRWKTVGKQMRSDNGDFLIFDRTFNPAGVPGQGDIFISLFDPKPRQVQKGGAHNNYDAPPPGGGGSRDLGDDIPFIMEWRI